MTARLGWYPKAREDLLELYIQVGSESPAAAECLYDSPEPKAAMLTRFPRLGPRRRDIGACIRMLVDGPSLILYEMHPDTDEGQIKEIEVIRVVDERRDLTRPF